MSKDRKPLLFILITLCVLKALYFSQSQPNFNMFSYSFVTHCKFKAKKKMENILYERVLPIQITLNELIL